MSGSETGRRCLLRGAKIAGPPHDPATPEDAPMVRRDVLVDGPRIARVAERIDPGEADETVEGEGRWLLPGLIDLQVNDIAWLAGGLREPEVHADRIRAVVDHQTRRGVTGFVLATLAAPLEEVLAYLVGMNRVLDAPRGARDNAFLGGLVEGTFMNPAFHGAHNPHWVVPPDRGLVDRFLATRAMRLLNVAPEMSEDAVEVIRHAASRGVVVGCGHAKPHAERVREAVDAGLRYVIHLGNGPTGSSLKAFHDGGLLEEALRDDRLHVTFIADGWHVHPSILRDWIARKGVARSIGVSDAGFALGPPDGGFEVLGVRGAAARDGRYLHVVPPEDAPPRNPRSSDAVALFGSAVDQLDVLEFLLGLLTREVEGVWHRHHPAWPLERAVAAASAMCAGNPGRLLGEADRGAVEEGSRADLVLARIEGEGASLRVGIERTFAGGEG